MSPPRPPPLAPGGWYHPPRSCGSSLDDRRARHLAGRQDPRGPREQHLRGRREKDRPAAREGRDRLLLERRADLDGAADRWRRADQDPHEDEPRRGPRRPPLRGAPLRGRGARALPRRAARVRAADRGGVLLRLRREGAVHAGRPRADRGEDARAGRGGAPVRAEGDGPRRGGEGAAPARLQAEGGASREAQAPGRGDLVLRERRPVQRHVPGPARGVVRQHPRVQDPLRVGRLLARRREGDPDAADPRHRVRLGSGAEARTWTSSRRRRSATTGSSARSSTSTRSTRRRPASPSGTPAASSSGGRSRTSCGRSSSSAATGRSGRRSS